MAIEQSGGFCASCNKQVVAWRNAPSHVLHLLLSLFTAGAWLIVWLILAARTAEARMWHCSQCGNQIDKRQGGRGSSIKGVVLAMLMLVALLILAIVIFG